MVKRSIEEVGWGPDGDRRRSIQSEHKGLTRRHLIEAAVEEFNELGYHATRVEDIVVAAGASRSTFYLHFKGKIDFVHELIAIVKSEAERIFARFDEANHISWEGLRDIIAEFVDFYTRHRMAMRAIEDAIAVDREAEAVYLPTISRFAEGLAKHIDRERDQEHDDAKLSATLLIVQFERFCFMWIVSGGWNLDRERTISSITDMWWRESRERNRQRGERGREPRSS